MMQRAVDYRTAQEVCVAVELARKGAGALVLERVTGFGSRWCRELVRENGGPISRRLRDPHRWFEADPQRLLHGRYIVMAYECQRVNRSPGRRLLGAYEAYRCVARQPGLLDINECAQIIDLYQTGNAWIRNCRECRLPHLVLYERPLCPVCRFLAKTLCRRCKQPLENVPAGTAYCGSCVDQMPSLAARRRREQERRVHRSADEDTRTVRPTNRFTVEGPSQEMPSRRTDRAPLQNPLPEVLANAVEPMTANNVG